MLSIKEANVLNRQQMQGNGGKNRYDYIEGGSRPREPNNVIPEAVEPKKYSSVLRPYYNSRTAEKTQNKLARSQRPQINDIFQHNNRHS